jgi:hypothetical protein
MGTEKVTYSMMKEGGFIRVYSKIEKIKEKMTTVFPVTCNKKEVVSSPRVSPHNTIYRTSFWINELYIFKCA